MATDRQILDLIRTSVGYQTTVGPVDKAKVDKALAGEPSKKPSAKLGKAAWHLARRIGGPPGPPPPPPPSYKKVAPRVAYKDGGSDARYCTVGQPGVIHQTGQPAGHTIDESGATYDDNGLCKNGLRSDGPAVTSALEIDGRPYCSLPTIGDPKTNTGSWGDLNGNGHKTANRAILALSIISALAIVAGIIVAAYHGTTGAVFAIVTGSVGGIVAIVLREKGQ